MGKILRFIFCFDTFEREKRFIQGFYEKKKGKSGAVVLKILSKIMEKTINDCIVLYLYSKKMDHMV